MTTRTLFVYFAIAFGLCWSIAGLFILAPEQAANLFGELSITNPLFFLATYAPAIAAFIIVPSHDGWSGFKRYLSRLLIWRAHWGWYALLLVGMPLCFYIGALIKQVSVSDLVSIGSIVELMPLLLLMLFLGPIEEFGWRGVALPLMQRSMAPIWAAIVLGVLWSIWHIPAFLLSDTPQATWSFMPFLLGSIAISVIITALFNRSQGSLLLPLLFHWQLVNPAWPDAQPYDHIAFVAVALFLVVLFRRSMFDRDGGITEVVPRESHAIGTHRPMSLTESEH